MQQQRQQRYGDKVWRQGLHHALRMLTVVGLVSSNPIVQAAEPFTNRSLQGSYGFLADGTIEGVGAVVATGLFTFDGEGACTFIETLNIAGSGSLSRVAETCTYTVHPDGTGTIVETFQPTATSHLAFVLVDNKKELRFMVTETGVLAGGVAKKQ